MAMQQYSAAGGILMQDKAYSAEPVMLTIPDQTLNDDIIFSTFNLHFCNPCCLGFGAFYNSIKARDSRMLGNFASARSYGTRARRLNIAALIIGFIFVAFFIIIIVMTSSQVTEAFNQRTLPGN